MKKKDKQCLLDSPPPPPPPPRPCTVMVNKENYYREYKGHTKWKSLCQNIFFGMTLLHAHAHYICLVCAKYQKASVKALVQVDFLMYALSKHTHNPYSIGNRKKWLIILSKINILASNFFTMFNVSILCKQSIRLLQQKLWYKLIPLHMHYLCINKMH